jgi:hypothetical protein
MVIYGNGPYFMSHIPMLNMPHDIQIVAEVILKDSSNKDIKFNFSNETFTVRPSQTFSLNNFVKGNFKTFTGSAHEGSFELGGQVVTGLEKLNIHIKNFLVIRSLLSNSIFSSFSLTDSVNVFEVNVITPERNFQEVLNSKSDERLWCVLGPDFFNTCP